jgi:hypothetical protein
MASKCCCHTGFNLQGGLIMTIRKFTCLVAAIFVTSFSGLVHAEDIAKSVAVRLRDSGTLDGYRVKVRAKQGTIWLEGEVSDAKNIAAAVGLAESTAGVERVVNRLVVASRSSADQSNLALPQRAWDDAGVRQPRRRATQVRELQNAEYSPNPERQVNWADGEPAQPVGPAVRVPARMAETPRPIRMSSSAPIQPVGMRSMSRQEMIGGEQVVPGSMQFYEGSAQVPTRMPAQASGPPTSMPMTGMANGTPRPMGAVGAGAPPIPMRGDGPNMPNYAWPSYASSPNYAALQYPTQYSPAAWPYIGPFYPYPQVPLGWRRVSLEWDDGWWYVDFDERHAHSHHR